MPAQTYEWHYNSTTGTSRLIDANPYNSWTAYSPMVLIYVQNLHTSIILVGLLLTFKYIFQSILLIRVWGQTSVSQQT